MENKKLENQYDAEGRAITSVSKKSKLDEAIAWARDMAYAGFYNLSLDEEQRYENIANWLEDYKDYRNANFDLSQVADNRYIEGYTQGIEDFAEKLSEVCHEESFEVHLSPGHFTAGIKAEVLTLDGVAEIIWDVAEQLKEGAVDG